MVGITNSALRAGLRDKWGWFLALGIILLIFGVIAAANILTATVATVYWVGLLMIAAGAVEAVHAFSVKGWGSSILGILAALVYVIAGWFAFSNPAAAAGAMTLFLGIALVVSGVIRLLIGFQERPLAGWGWVVLSGIVTILAGAIIISGWPANSVWILGLFLAVDLIVQGISYIALSFALKRL